MRILVIIFIKRFYRDFFLRSKSGIDRKGGEVLDCSLGRAFLFEGRQDKGRYASYPNNLVLTLRFIR
jgi:hypothetical protein